MRQKLSDLQRSSRCWQDWWRDVRPFAGRRLSTGSHRCRRGRFGKLGSRVLFAVTAVGRSSLHICWLVSRGGARQTIPAAGSGPVCRRSRCTCSSAAGCFVRPYGGMYIADRPGSSGLSMASRGTRWDLAGAKSLVAVMAVIAAARSAVTESSNTFRRRRGARSRAPKPASIEDFIGRDKPAVICSRSCPSSSLIVSPLPRSASRCEGVRSLDRGPPAAGAGHPVSSR